MRGEKPERWVRQTDFSNDEAVGFLADRLNRLGVETRLLELGAEEGDAVLIGHPDNSVVFDFKPGHRRRRRDARPPRRGPALRRVARRPPGAAARSTRRWTTAPRARPAPTWPAASTSPRRYGPSSYEIGTPDDPDWAEDDPGVNEPGMSGAATGRDQPARRGDRRPARRRQGRLVVADHRRGRHRPRPGPPARRRARRAARPRRRGGAGLLGRDRRRARAARPGPPPARPAPPSRPRPPSARACWCTATPRSWPGTASIAGQVLLTARRRDPALALPQRLPDLRQAARARRAADRQRERHGRHHRDPVRRQRPARRAGRPPRARRPAGAALRRRRPVRRRPGRARQRAWSPTWPRRGRPRRRRASAAPAPRASAPAACRPRSRPPGSPPAPASRWCSPPPTAPPTALAGEPVGTLFHATGRRRPTRLLWLAHATEPKGTLLLDAGAVRARRRAPRLAARRRRHRRHRQLRRRRPGRPAGPDGVAGRPRAWSTSTPRRCPSLLGRSSHELKRELGAAYEREVVHRDDLVLL